MPGQMVEFAANGSTAKGYLARIARSSTTGRPDAYSADAARDAWERTLRFFRQHVR